VGGVSVIVTDLTEFKATELALRQTVADLEAFSYSISHDMRTPLRAMQGFSSMLLNSCANRLSEEELDYLRRIVASSSRLDQLIRDVLRYSRTARSELTLAPVDAGKLIHQVIESYPAFLSPQAEITLDGGIPAVIGHEALLSQCVSNLLDNAVKFTPPGQVPRVQISAQKENGEVRISFRDSGIGIDPRHQERIFRIFERVHPLDKYGGTGIGLSIVKKAMERMGGKIGVESELGKGSSFWIQLPAAKE
jgi:signal transduction histidine kinase